MRGGRLDEAGAGPRPGPGDRRDLVEASAGELTLGRSDLGGLAVSMLWKTRVGHAV
jgi:hypothetical protein